MAGFVIRLAWRFLRAPGREGLISLMTWFSLIGIALGVATLIIVMAVMNGYRHDLITRILGLNGHVVVRGEPAITGYDRLATELRRHPAVEAVVPMIESQAMVTAGERARGVVLRGVSRKGLLAKPVIRDNIVAGDLSCFGESRQVLLGMHLARQLAVQPGDSIRVLSPQSSQTAFGRVPRSRTFEVCALFRIGMYEYDVNFMFASLADSQRFFRLPEQVGSLELRLDSPDVASRVARELAGTVGDGLAVYDWSQSSQTLAAALEVERNVMFLILTLIILVAAFNIVSGQVMLVRDKTRGIAILRTMGASRRQILAIFMLTGSVIGLAGTIAGAAGGIVFAANIEEIRRFLESLAGIKLFQEEVYYLARLPARMEAAQVIMVMLMAMGLTFLASLYPAWRAARVDPAPALRNE